MVSDATSLAVDLNSLVDQYSEPSESKTFEIYYPRGELLTCRLPHRFGDWKDYEAEIVRFWKLVSTGRVHDTWKPFLPITFQESVAVTALFFWSAEPTKVSELLALRHVKLGGGAILRSLYTQIQQKIDHEGFERFVAEVDNEKKDSEQTLPDESQQEPPPSTSENLLTR